MNKEKTSDQIETRQVFPIDQLTCKKPGLLHFGAIGGKLNG